MRRRWQCQPNLLDCLLEERISPAITNLGIIVLTTSGLALVTPFPGASNSAAGSLGASSGSGNTAAGVSGAAMPTSFYVTGIRGISSFAPGNFTGNPLVGGGGAVGSSGGVTLTIRVGSGADEAGGPVVTTPAASRTNPAGSATDAPSIMAYIGQPSSSTNSPVLPEGASYRTPAAPVPALPAPGVVIPGPPMGPTGGGSMMPGANPFNPPLGLPGSSSGPAGRINNSLPGGLGVGGVSMSPGPGMN